METIEIAIGKERPVGPVGDWSQQCITELGVISRLYTTFCHKWIAVKPPAGQRMLVQKGSTATHDLAVS
ncbi:hypothetical protein IFM89_037044 [Coptis chinensis]|uniref:Uncharacterized protein n=1 Tax=Coptis chinensis TaxID=261450 RepID=A0A835H9Y0_9MAGN|nr:hypothetical protein IFM89_037044 [Coptis chinensis]